MLVKTFQFTTSDVKNNCQIRFDGCTPVAQGRLEDLLQLVGEYKRSDEVYVSVASLTPGVSYFGNEMEDLPTSVLRVMTDSSDRGTGVFLRTQVLKEQTARLDRPVAGAQRILVEVKPPRSELYD